MATNFSIQAGEPFPQELDADAQRIRVTLPTGRSYWTEADDFEVLMQVREQAKEDSTLVADLAEFLTVSMDGDDDILIDWAMTGEDTRALTGGGFYDMVISDPDTVDVRAKIVLSGKIRVKPIVTAAEAAP